MDRRRGCEQCYWIVVGEKIRKDMNLANGMPVECRADGRDQALRSCRTDTLLRFIDRNLPAAVMALPLDFDACSG